jgi:Nif-specific regulatory protein
MSPEQSRLGVLLELSRRLVDAGEGEGLLRDIQEAVVRLLEAEGCSVALVNPASEQVDFTTADGSTFQIPLGQGIAGHTIRTGEPALVNDVRKDPRFYAGVDTAMKFETRSLLCVPLVRAGQVIGALSALNTAAPGGFQPADLDLLVALSALAAAAIDRTRTLRRVANENLALREAEQARHVLVLGESVSMQRAVRMARTAAATRSTVLLLGESGTGKEVLARAIHGWSQRSEGPFVAVNCLALTPELLESELFGHERGAFTGAISQKKGKFELADGGTLFLDEIGDLAPKLQAKLLRVLQEREFQRVGGTRDLRTDVRVVAATNRDLRRAIEEGSFREDLYYRLNVVSIALPPLRERHEDLDALIDALLVRIGRELGLPRMRLSEEARAALRSHDWPGNVRELANALERAMVLAEGDRVELLDLPPEVQQGAGRSRASVAADGPLPSDGLSLSEAVDAFKMQRIRAAMEQAGGNQTRAAELLGMRQSNLSRLMKSLGLK